MPENQTRLQLVRAASDRAKKIRAVAQHLTQRLTEPMPVLETQAHLSEYIRELSLTSAVREYLRAKQAEREN